MSAAHIYNREQLVQLVKDVLGEVQEIQQGRSYAVQFADHHRAISVEFVCGTRLVGNYLIPIPPEMVALLENEERNPYRLLAATFRTTNEIPGSVMVKAPSSSEGT